MLKTSLLILFCIGSLNAAYQSCSKVTPVGCFNDNRFRDMNDTLNIQTYIANITVAKCVDFCCKYYTRFAGLQSTSCFCSNSSTRTLGRANDTDCRIRCQGNSSDLCGGSWKNSVYEFVNPNPPPVKDIQNLPFEGKYVGCFIDSSTRDLNITSWSTANQTVERCLSFCRDRLCNFAGLQSTTCFCSNSSTRIYGRANEFDCWRPCGGNPDQICGGNWRNSVYSLKGASIPDARALNLPHEATYIGCFIDAADRDLNVNVNISTYIANNTIEKCINFCRDRFCTIAGVQSTSCFCSNDTRRKYGKASEFDCFYKCAGNANQFCGGAWRNSVYQFKGITPPEKNLNYLPYQAKYVGCFIDKSDRDLNAVSTWITNMTIQSCIRFCYDRKTRIAGIQNNLCSCSNDDNRKYGNASEFECWIRCSSNSSQICGGSWRNSVYSFTPMPLPDSKSIGLPYNVEYLGCYVDQSDRDLNFTVNDQIWISNCTYVKCIEYCRNSYAKYAGLQYYSQCFCSNSTIGKYGKANEMDCYLKCSGNPNDICGGSWRNSIFRFDPKPPRVFPNNGSYLGCFIDQGNRDLDLTTHIRVNFENNTIESCISFCWKNYAKYAGLQYSRQCFCSNNATRKYGKGQESECNMKCSGDRFSKCGGSWRNSIYEFTPRPNPCDVSPSPCTSDQICEPALDGTAMCLCKPGFTKIATGLCCKSIQCGCWGDPHCHSFDSAPFEFQGRCKYDVITTNCYNRTLPAGYVPFTVQQKQENRPNVPNSANVAFVAHIAVLFSGYEIRLLKKNGSIFSWTLNGTFQDIPYEIPGLFTVSLRGKNIVLSCSFGLTIVWDGVHRVDYSLCDAYATYVCGLCGNADKNLTNDYVDRMNVQVPLIGNRYVQYYNWGSKYRVYDDSDTTNNTNSTCNPVNPPGTIVGPNCKDPAVYDGNSWCGAMNNLAGVWGKCIPKVDSMTKLMMTTGCSFDLCTYENNALQRSFLCSAYEKFNAECIKLFPNTTFNWRSSLNCPASCAANQTYVTLASCPKTCEHPDGDYDCGELTPIESCYCANNYVLDENYNCILQTDCPVPPPLPHDAVYFGCYRDGTVPDLELNITQSNTTTIESCIEFCYQNRANIAGLQASNKCSCSRNSTRRYGSVNDLNCNMKCAGNNNEICGGSLYNSIYVFDPMPIEENITVPKQPDDNLVITRSPPFNISNFDLTGYCNETKTKCYIFGDPHYITFKNGKFLIAPNCTYMIASDSCNVSQPSTYQIYAVQEYRENSPYVSYLGGIVVKFGGKTYSLNKTFSIDNVLTDIPYGSANDQVYVIFNQTTQYIQFTTKFFTFSFDGDHYFRLSQCGTQFCGVCNIQYTVNQEDYRPKYNAFLVNDPSTSTCASTNQFPSIKVQP